MRTETEENVDEHNSPSVLGNLKEELVFTDLINRLEIANGLKEVLINKGFTLKSLLYTSTSDFAKILGIDEYIAKLLSDAVNKVVNTLAFNATTRY